jgi:hypothetical protein
MADDSNMERRHIDTMWKQKDIQVFYSIRTFLLKLDGYRALASKQNGKIHLRSRNDNDFNGRYPSIVRALAALPDETVVDGRSWHSVRTAGPPSTSFRITDLPAYRYIFTFSTCCCSKVAM